MKKNLRNFMLLAALLFSGFSQQAEASHYQGSELTYACIAPGVYRTTLKLYRDCTGIAAPSSAVLNIKSLGCNPGRNVTMTKICGNRIGDPYCASMPKTCSSTGAANDEEVIFTGTVTFTSAEMACPEWIMSWSECCRPSAANVQGQATMYTEAMVYFDNGQTAINNNSPAFNPLELVVPYVNAYMPITVSAYAHDVDNDSLVYTLVNPLDNPQTPLTYINYGPLVINDPDPNSTKTALAPAGTFSATFPMHSFQVDWSQATPVATPYFELNPNNGSLSFVPTAYFPNSTPVQGLNKYVVVVKIDEYRKINGQATKIGSIRREMFITIMDCGPNTNPVVASPVANGQPITPNDIIHLRPGTPLNLQLAADDSNVNDVLIMSSDAESMLQGSSFVVTPGSRPTATLTWTPSASHARDQIYYFRVTVTDDACPLKGVQVQTFGVKVSNTGGVTGTSNPLKQDLAFVAYPNPFQGTVSFKLNNLNAAAQEILIFNMLGQQIDKISLQNLSAGEQRVVWQNGNLQANGHYIAKLMSGSALLQTLKFTKVQ